MIRVLSTPVRLVSRLGRQAVRPVSRSAHWLKVRHPKAFFIEIPVALLIALFAISSSIHLANDGSTAKHTAVKAASTELDSDGIVAFVHGTKHSVTTSKHQSGSTATNGGNNGGGSNGGGNGGNGGGGTGGTTPIIPGLPPVTVPPISTPIIKLPGIDTGIVKVPAITIPSVHVPSLNLTSGNVPSVTVPSITVPSVSTLIVSTPTLKTPNVSTPSVSLTNLTVNVPGVLHLHLGL